MTDFCKSFFILVLFLVSFGYGRNGCRQCTGEKAVTIMDYVTEAQALLYVRASFGNCATGNEYEFTGSVHNNCETRCLKNPRNPSAPCSYPKEPLCKNWVFSMTIWRYCGNGGEVYLRKVDQGSFDPRVHRPRPNYPCFNGLCAYQDDLHLECTKSVDCHGKCDCPACVCNTTLPPP